MGLVRKGSVILTLGSAFASILKLCGYSQSWRVNPVHMWHTLFDEWDRGGEKGNRVHPLLLLITPTAELNGIKFITNTMVSLQQ